ncbi:DNA endonuclease SmrA [Erwinia tasmaniensis]|uniref:DNA endonuclease SmrA n=1 Tax=Erwinia tasmaniensis TaxID=338565 RepID=UPI003A4DFAA2
MTNPDDYALFREAVGDVTPLSEGENVLWLKPPALVTPRAPVDDSPDNPLIDSLTELLSLTTPLEYKAEGIQQGVLDKLRQGKYRPEASLNLIRQPIETCRQALYQFMRQAEKDNIRNLLIIHGKGRDTTSHANIVRSYLSRWLQQFENVQSFCHAQVQHGGSGACYVALRKSERARLDNRERHAKRSR